MAVIISTRPLDDALIDADVLAEHNIKCLPAPMMTINSLNIDVDQYRDDISADAVALTSRHAVELIAGTAWANAPIYCVGESTARLARDAGMTNIMIGPGDGDGLTKMIGDGEHRHIFWPSAVDVGFDLAQSLNRYDVHVTRIPIYKAATTDTMPEDVIKHLQDNKVAVVMVHSGRAGAHFANMLHQYGMGHLQSSIDVVAISARVAGHCGDGWRNIKVAATPRRSAMFDAAIAIMKTTMNKGMNTAQSKDISKGS